MQKQISSENLGSFMVLDVQCFLEEIENPFSC